MDKQFPLLPSNISAKIWAALHEKVPNVLSCCCSVGPRPPFFWYDTDFSKKKKKRKKKKKKKKKKNKEKEKYKKIVFFF